ncbi:hypothetical protein Q8W37_17455 [Shimia thalassica]|uniref:hypothetical protein n=1 Tax=Shimia thalassica TaxID=1715693 RepID=UPI0027340E19|nr:hypothetical protein [Shimia thalassica]MDP2581730.1 hypothetical protein [Shimia thalassica]
MIAKTPFAIGFAFVAGAAMAQNAPLSAIEWLDQTPTVTIDMGQPVFEPPVLSGPVSAPISVDTLDAPARDAVGLLPTAVTGLPNSLWQNSDANRVSALISRQRPELMPAMQALLYTLLLAEANTPMDTASGDRFLLARIDKLIEMGALEQASALVERSGPTTPPLFKRWFDVALLMGEEEAACQALTAAPHLSPDYASRIFCTARAGDWNAAALTLETANALRLLTEEEDALLLRFLDPELFEGEPMMFAPRSPTPLTFRLYEAIGEHQPTSPLPRPFAHADIRSTAGWKSRLEAAERLARTGALPENRLIGIYSEGKPSASGMIWDRVAAIQKFDEALANQDTRRVAETLPKAWSAAQSVHLEVPFARIFGAALLDLDLTGVSHKLARDIALLSPQYEAAARLGPRDFLAGLALGNPPRTPADPLHRAISDGFHGARVPQEVSSMLARGQLGEAILHAMSLMADGSQGDLTSLTDALAIFRAVGLEDTARQAALQAAIIDTRG